MSLAAIQSAHLLDLSTTLTTLAETLTMISYAFRKTSPRFESYILDLQGNDEVLSSSVSELQQEQLHNPKADLSEEIEMMKELVGELKEDVAEVIRSGEKVGVTADGGSGAFNMETLRREVEFMRVSVEEVTKHGGKGCDVLGDCGAVKEVAKGRAKGSDVQGYGVNLER